MAILGVRVDKLCKDTRVFDSLDIVLSSQSLEADRKLSNACDNGPILCRIERDALEKGFGELIN